MLFVLEIGSTYLHSTIKAVSLRSCVSYRASLILYKPGKTGLTTRYSLRLSSNNLLFSSVDRYVSKSSKKKHRFKNSQMQIFVVDIQLFSRKPDSLNLGLPINQRVFFFSWSFPHSVCGCYFKVQFKIVENVILNLLNRKVWDKRFEFVGNPGLAFNNRARLRCGKHFKQMKNQKGNMARVFTHSLWK